MKISKEVVSCVLSMLLIILTLFIAATNNKKVAKVSHNLTEGSVNTVLIVLIIVLTLTEDMQVGFVLTVLYLIMLVRFRVRENFESGPSPLNCDTYGDSKKKTGIAQYPLHA